MRTTLEIDDDVLAAAQELAKAERTTVGGILSSLARKALVRADAAPATRAGVPLLSPSFASARVTSELVKQLSDELA